MKKLVGFFLLSVFFLTLMLTSCEKQNSEVKLRTNIDSVTYAQGVLLASQVDRIFTQLEFKKTNKVDFINGFQNGLKINIKNKKESAFTIGKMIGYQVGTQFIPFFNKQLFYNDSTKTISKNILLAGYISAIKNDNTALLSAIEVQKYSKNTMIEKIKKNYIEKQYKKFKKENLDFLKKNKFNKGVVVLPSGLQYKIVKEGKGGKPKATDFVKINYRALNIKGKIIDSSVKNGKSIKVSLNELIKGLSEGIQLMHVGSKYIFCIPYYLAYGAQPKENGLPPYSTIIFETELREIVIDSKNNRKS